MGLNKTIWTKPSEYLRAHKPVDPVLFFAPAVLQATARKFLEGFPGLVTYAVKSNPDEVILTNLVAAGIQGFGVASPAEMATIARIAPGAAMHYNNPVRSRDEIAYAVKMGVKSYSVDSFSELEKLIALVPAANTEITVRIKLPVSGAAYNFGAKFGATLDKAAALLARVAEAGFIPSITFHPGTQCVDPMAWDSYIRAAAEVAQDAGVKIARLNVGGGFPAHRLIDIEPQLDEIFALIDRVTTEAFGDDRPALVCEPGRGLVAECYSAVVCVKAIRDGEHVFMNDGVYGLFDELPVIGIIDRIDVLSPEGKARTGEGEPRICFGPTCDSIDRLPGELMLPADMVEGDYMVFNGFGAYSTATATRFNGFGNVIMETVYSFKG
ncbi:MAG: type III PLP-dependent enzyme [Deltaproteobacteria bacterium]